MEKDRIQEPGKRMVAAYILIMFIGFYSACFRLPTGVKYGINLVVTAIAFFSFLKEPRMEDARFCLRFLAMNLLPYFVFWIWSLILWIFQFQSLDYIMRGCANVLYMFTNIACICASVYLFRERAILYVFIGMVLANALTVLQVMAAEGVVTILQEYIRLLVSFAEETGSGIAKLELHEMTYGWGGMILFFALHRQKNLKWNVLGCLISFLFFTIAFKRIGIAGVLVGFAFGILMKVISDNKKGGLLVIGALGIALSAFAYLYLIKTGVFYEWAERLGINLMGRDRIYSEFEDFYELLPGFVGHGIRFIYRYGVSNHTTDTIHNVYLELYIETGFWCWLFWLFYDLYYRVRWIKKHYSWQAAGMQIAMNGYLFVTYLTDNTFFHYPINMVCRMAVMVYSYKVYRNGSGNVLQERGGAGW